MFDIDGTRFIFPCDLQRKVTLESSSSSGMMLSRNYFNDVIASYLSYSVKLVIPLGQEQNYSRLFSMLSKPVGEHYFTFPYNQTTISFYGKIDSISDKYYRRINGKEIWRDVSFEVTATRPLVEPIISWLIYEYYTNVTSDIPANFVIDGEALSFQLTADEGYAIDSVSVIMGDDDITEDVYDSQDNTIAIPSVTGDVTVTATAVEVNES